MLVAVLIYLYTSSPSALQYEFHLLKILNFFAAEKFLCLLEVEETPNIIQFKYVSGFEKRGLDTVSKTHITCN